MLLHDSGADGPAYKDVDRSSVMHRTLHDKPTRAVRGEGIYLYLEDGSKFIDATAGAAVCAVGHGNKEVQQAMIEQIEKVSYVGSVFFSTEAAEELCTLLIKGTQGKLSRAYICNSGSEAAEAAMKMARQYFVELEGRDTPRRRFISRQHSYHGTTLGALGLGGHVGRRAIFEPMLSTEVSRVSPCFAYRGMQEGETTEQYVERLASELDAEFQRLGPETVCAFVAEPVVGAALGCVPPVPGYFKAMRKVCDKHGALLILDEIMSGMGRSGYLHAWQSPLIDCPPDLQTMGKGLGGGYQAIAAVLASPKVVNVLTKGTGAFAHGHTYQAHPVACAASSAVQKIIMQPDMMPHVREMGALLEKGLRANLADKWYVGNIRGMGLFWGIELVKDRATKEPFDPKELTAMGVHKLGLLEPHLIAIYPGTGTVDGLKGDHVMLCPPYNVTKEEIELIVQRVTACITAYFDTKYSKKEEPPVQITEDAKTMYAPEEGTMLAIS